MMDLEYERCAKNEIYTETKVKNENKKIYIIFIMRVHNTSLILFHQKTKRRVFQIGMKT